MRMLGNIFQNSKTLTNEERQEIVHFAWGIALHAEKSVILAASILHDLSKSKISDQYEEYRRPWIFRRAVLQAEKLNAKGLFRYKPHHKHFTALEKKLLGLSLDQRMIALLKHKFGFSHSEITEIMGISLGSLLFRSQKIDSLFQDDNGMKLEMKWNDLENPHLKSELFDEAKPHVLKNMAKGHLAYQRAFPWYVRVGMEGMLVASLLLLFLGAIPKMKHEYEKWSRGKLDFYGTLSVPVADLANEFLPKDSLSDFIPEEEAAKGAVKNKMAAYQASEPVISFNDVNERELASIVNFNIQSEYEEKENVIARYNTGRGKIHRLYIKSENPKAVKKELMELIEKANAKKAGNVDLGTESLGGIYFNFHLRKDNYRELLKSMKEKYEIKNYVNYSKRRIPRGLNHVMVWVQQM